MNTNYLRNGLCALVVSSLISLSAHAEDISEVFDVSSGGTLDLRTDIGSLEITTHSEDTVVLNVYMQGVDEDDFKIETSTRGGDLEITGKFKRKRSWGWNRKVEFELTVPENYNLDMETSGGSISIVDITGNVDAHTSGGSISVGNIRGDVELHTSGGSIRSESIFGHLDAHTSGGSINVTIAEPLTDDAELHTSGGSITATLHQDSRLDIDASTSGGRVRSEFDVDGNIKKQSIRGEINGGGPKLKLRTSGGNIRIESL